ncbi:MAG TPA: hypothetical protein VK469_19150 [Candidatus Kapabacteria bacterium]|nr:hypothetical protein [Candidatus Kapabacteria bacterium]
MNLKKKSFAHYVWIGLFVITVFAVRDFAQDKKKNTLTGTIVLEIAQPTFEKIATADENLEKQLTYYLKIAAVVDEKNREKPFTLFGNQAKGKIARWLEAASELERQDCYKKYLYELARNIRERGDFFVESPSWLSLEQDRLEIVFPQADRYSAAMQVLQTFFNISAGSYSWGKGNFFDAAVFFNNPDVTLKYKEYTDVFPLMQDHLYALPALANSRQEIYYSPLIPSFKIAQLIFASQPEIRGGAFVYPDIDVFGQDAADEKYKNEEENKFKIIVFRNIAETYFEGVLKPISAGILTAEQVRGLDPEIYLSNLIMRRIAHHLGPVFVIASKGEDRVDRVDKGGKMGQKKEQKSTTAQELKTVSELLGNLFPVLEAVKSQAVAIYNTPVLINSGLLPDDKAANVYLTYLVTLIDQLRNTPNEMNAPQQPGKKNWEELLGDAGKENYLAALIQFNYLLAEECIILNIGSRTLDINREKFSTAVGALTGEVIRMMTYPNYDTTRWFIEKNSVLSPQLREILKSVEDIPFQVTFHLEKPALIKEDVNTDTDTKD